MKNRLYRHGRAARRKSQPAGFPKARPPPLCSNCYSVAPDDPTGIGPRRKFRYPPAFMELDLAGKHASRAYPILASLVTPRPIALVTTLSPEGVINIAPFSFFNVFGAEPPIVAFAPGDRDDGTP